MIADQKLAKSPTSVALIRKEIPEMPVVFRLKT